MNLSPTIHKKLKNPKNATVSMDSLLGLLSSAYKTEELDSKGTGLADKNIDWENLSLEKIRAAPKKENIEKQKQNKGNESEKIHVTTSTTSLRVNKSCESEIDVTLISIKSLENLQQSNGQFETEKSVVNKTGRPNRIKSTESIQEENNKTIPNTTDAEIHQVLTVNSTESKNELEQKNINEQQRLPICGFHVDDSNKKVIFNIQFMQKMYTNKLIPVFHIGEPDISIHVTDTSKPTTLCIDVAKSYLVSKIKYFDEVNKEFDLEELEVFVTCNLNVFQWIIQWVKADIAMCKPNLNLNNVKSVLSMAYHLGIGVLVEECLDYFYHDFKNILHVDSTIQDVFDDELIQKLAKRFTNTEINEMCDIFESFKMRIFCAMIKFLVDTEPTTSFGHYSTLASIFQCGSCEKLVNNDMQRLVPCRTDCNKLDFKGELIYCHERSSSWDLSGYIELMYEEFKSWELVYWRLWGLCHFLKCSECRIPYPLVQSEWCSYHPDTVEYFPLNTNFTYPIGMYKCCRERAFKFNVLEPYGGCKSKCHTPELDSNDKMEIYKIYQTQNHLIGCKPSENLIIKKFVQLVKKQPEEMLQNEALSKSAWWEGIHLAPKEKRDYSIISLEILNRLRNKPQERKNLTNLKPLHFGTPVAFGIMPPCAKASIEKTNLTIEVPPPCSKKNRMKPTKKVKSMPVTSLTVKNKIRKRKLSYGYQPTESFWVSSESIKDNQDNQRDFEEIAMRSLVKILSSSTGAAVSPELSSAGSYIRLEADWWEEHCINDPRLAGATKSSGTVVNRTFPLSWFRRLTI